LLHLCIFGLGPIRDLLVSSALLMCLVFFGIGMGDIKLLGLIIITHPFNTFEYLLSILLVAGVHIVVLIGLHRRIPSKIPLAPSIFLALLTYLAAR
jgi:Flp pilus assembly protein protease CpaA